MKTRNRKIHPAFPPVSCKYGAPMGRRNVRPCDLEPVDQPASGFHVCHLAQARQVDGDYDQGGAYWGLGNGDSIFCAWNRAGIRLYVRAKSRGHAIRQIIAEYPEVRIRLAPMWKP